MLKKMVYTCSSVTRMKSKHRDNSIVMTPVLTLTYFNAFFVYIM